MLKKIGKDKSPSIDARRSVLEDLAHVCILAGNSLKPLEGTGHIPDVSPAAW